MSLDLALQSPPWSVLAICVVVVVMPVTIRSRRGHLWLTAALAGLVTMTLLAATPTPAYVLIAATTLLHALMAAQTSRTGALMLAVSAIAAGAAGAAISAGAETAAFWLSCLTIMLRSGILPFHTGVASLCDRAPIVQVQQLATMIALVFVHLHFVNDQAGAVAAAPWVLRYGAVATIVAALITIVQRDLRGLYRGTVTLHAGMLLAAIGGASLDTFAAALIVAVAMGVALAGLGLSIIALEERVGPVGFDRPEGRISAFPRLAVAFAFFGGAGVGLPGTAGFIADDLLLHTLWLESPASATVVIIASALLAVATLLMYSNVFLGRPISSLAPDLRGRERAVVLILAFILVSLGFVPGTLITPADTVLSQVVLPPESTP